MGRMKALMAGFRSHPPGSVAGLKVVRIRDYSKGSQRVPGQRWTALDSPLGDLVMFDLEAEGNYLAVRPSGTEPKIKVYLFAFDPPQQSQDVAAARQRLAARLAAMEKDLREAMK
jgi:phosphoglucomutase/phosphomannomutase